MASKSELAAQAVALGGELGRVIDVEGLSGQALAQLVEELQAAKAALVPPASAPAVEQAPVVEPTFSVAPGASVGGTRKGALHELAPIGAGDLFGGQEALAALVASGHVVEDKLEP